MKLVIRTVLAFVAVFILIVGGMAVFLTRGLDSGSKMVINQVNTSSLSDGTYNGKYSGGRFSNEVNVTVKDHKITKIEVVKDVTFPKPEWTKELFERVIGKQSVDVDIVSGATVTSKAYLKSIENALKR